MAAASSSCLLSTSSSCSSAWSPATGPILRCSFGRDELVQSTEVSANREKVLTNALLFRPNQGKRSSFVLDLNSSYNGGLVQDENLDGSNQQQRQLSPSTYVDIPCRPCHCYVECIAEGPAATPATATITHSTGSQDEGEENSESQSSSQQQHQKLCFFLGGFQLVSSARCVDVYVTRHGESTEEKIMTCRGIPVRDATTSSLECAKVFCVIPGGPRPVTRLHLKLSPGDNNSASTTACKTTNLVSIHMTGRIPDWSQQQKMQRQEQLLAEPHPPTLASSAAAIMQQMMMTPNSLFSAPTPLASGSSAARNPFFGGTTVDGMLPIPKQALAVESQSDHTTRMHTHAGGTPSNSEAILAGVSFMIRSEGQVTAQFVQRTMDQKQSHWDQQMQLLEKKLESQEALLQTVIQKQETMMAKQIRILEQMQQQMYALTVSNQELVQQLKQIEPVRQGPHDSPENANDRNLFESHASPDANDQQQTTNEEARDGEKRDFSTSVSHNATTSTATTTAVLVDEDDQVSDESLAELPMIKSDFSKEEVLTDHLTLTPPLEQGFYPSTSAENVDWLTAVNSLSSEFTAHSDVLSTAATTGNQDIQGKARHQTCGIDDKETAIDRTELASKPPLHLPVCTSNKYRMDGCSIRVENGSTVEFLSLPSGDAFTVPSIDQAESIEVLPVFPASPSVTGSTPRSLPTKCENAASTGNGHAEGLQNVFLLEEEEEEESVDGVPET